MNKIELIKALTTHYNLFVEYIISITDEKFNAHLDQKWNAGQELNHIVKSVVPLAKILSDKSLIIENYGTINRPILSFDDLKKRYKNELKNGGSATGNFIPEEDIDADKKKELISMLLDYVKMVENNLADFTEEELNTLILPHPLLGKLTIREMIYFTIYHAEHHKRNIERNIEQITTINGKLL